MKTCLDIHNNDIIIRRTVKALLCGLLEHERVTTYKGSDLLIDSGRYRITITNTGVKIGNKEAPGLVFYYMAYESIYHIGLECINERSGDLALYIELDDGSCIIIPDESGIEIKGKVLDMVNYARAAVNIEKELYDTEEE